mmetsp:Transcript_5689/g.16796  ORF Transcript_5689/g.16796 Transcript_5689/m.16796 type:complete len:136 (+) Transcript_5689:67-474(+)
MEHKLGQRGPWILTHHVKQYVRSETRFPFVNDLRYPRLIISGEFFKLWFQGLEEWRGLFKGLLNRALGLQKSLHFANDTRRICPFREGSRTYFGKEVFHCCKGPLHKNLELGNPAKRLAAQPEKLHRYPSTTQAR